MKQGSANSEQVFSLRNLIPGTCDCRVVPLMLCLRRSTSIGIPLPALNVSRETGYREGLARLSAQATAVHTLAVCEEMGGGYALDARTR